MSIQRDSTAKPFLKWAGGKSQLLNQIDEFLPDKLTNGEINRYIEPFLGGGAFFFHIAQQYKVEEFILSDINPDLFMVYSTVKNNLQELIKGLIPLFEKFNQYIDDIEERNKLYYNIRDKYNVEQENFDYTTYNRETFVDRSIQFIFLNKTCFNGLYRVNSKGFFNVPMGKFKSVGVNTATQLLLASKILHNVKICLGNYTMIKDLATENSFIYFDPPYRKLNKTSNFNSYYKFFSDEDQIKLSKFYKSLDAQGALLMLSNSDPRNINPEDDFFDDLYSSFNIHRVKANRKINSDSTKRGDLTEILITNY
jgi:DNA adenine methylase